VTPLVHPTAIVHAQAELGPEVVVGPFAIIGPGVEVGESSEIAGHAVIERDTQVGCHCSVGYGTVIGTAPQDAKYHGEPTLVVIGDGTRIREYTTINRGTTASGATRIGARCFLMSYVHVAHDCQIGDEVTIANAVQLAGHVEVGHHAWIGGQTPIHQFVRIGEYAFVGGGSRIPQDVPPFTRTAGSPHKMYGINAVGLRRAGFSSEVRLALKRAYRLLFNSSLTTSAAVQQLRSEPNLPDPVQQLVDFVAGSERGVMIG
jgi:UDP-N-acetylglucosamine acyltransferase